MALEIYSVISLVVDFQERRNRMSDKPNCYKCIHRGSVPGNAHSCCKHPSLGEIADNPMIALMSMLGGNKVKTGPVTSAAAIKVVGNPHGIANGWFMHPFNFDPAWLEECNGFEAKEG